MNFITFEKILKEAIMDFSEINKIGVIGILGSNNIKKDVDILILPKAKIKKGEFLKILHNFLELLNKKLNSKIIVFNHSYFKEEIEHLAKRTNKDIFLHLLSFSNIETLQREDKNNIKQIKKTIKIYYGDKKSIKLAKRTNKDHYYNYLLSIYCLFSKYPKKLEDKKIKNRIKYIFKCNKSQIEEIDKSNKKLFFECCDFLDSKARFI